MRVVIRHELLGRYVRVVRRLYAKRGEERLARVLFLFLRSFFHITDQKIGQFIGFETRQSVMECVLVSASVNPTVPLAVVVVVAGPVLEAAALGRVGDEESRASVPLVPAG